MTKKRQVIKILKILRKLSIFSRNFFVYYLHNIRRTFSKKSIIYVTFVEFYFNLILFILILISFVKL